ncbi:immediate early protein ICP-46 [Frog virus 3]|uniref:Immediate early protein ICP-46 n=1 Tax=Frog virus 3 TaxID=10493 RepID=A0A5B8P395_FRG3V|nr:immediate early protein ICP-46 [Frog virus 3]
MANFVTDSRNGLTISCAPQDQSHLHPTIRALVMEGDSVIFRGLPHPDIHREAPPAGLRIKDCLVYDSYEGALVNVFWAQANLPQERERVSLAPEISGSLQGRRRGPDTTRFSPLSTQRCSTPGESSPDCSTECSS